MTEQNAARQYVADQENCMYQVSTLQALMLGYLRTVVTVQTLLQHGDTGLGTFEDVNGEMIVLDGHCYRALHDGTVCEADPTCGIPFGVVSRLKGARAWDLSAVQGMQTLLEQLNNKIEEHFGLNSMHIVRIDGTFDLVDARSEVPSPNSQHVTLKKLLDQTQYAFQFHNVHGSLIGLYFPDYMDGLNMPGWHLHFLSEDRTQGGHVFDVQIRQAHVRLDKVARVELQLPTEPRFDTYALKTVSQEETRAVEQGKE